MSTIALTGSSGFIGTRLLTQLENDPEVEKIIGIDLKPGRNRSPKLESHRMDVRDPGLEELFRSRGADVVIHLAFIVNPLHDAALMHDIDVSGARNVLQATRACAAGHLIMASSTTAFGAFPDNPDYLKESDAPRRRGNNTYADDKYEVEGLVREFKERNRDVKVAVVRPCIVFGPSVDNYISRFLLRLPVIPTVAGTRPEMQFVHEDDAATVFRKVFDLKAEGYFHAIGEGVIGLEEIARLAGKRIVDLPARLAYPAVDLLWKVHAPFIEGPSSILDFIRYRWLASDEDTRRALDHQPRYSSREVLADMIKKHRKRA
jgi:UDP-glucose 4-epimerase